MTDRDHPRPAAGDEPRRRRPGFRGLGSVSDALARLMPRPRGDDGPYGDGRRTAMSDEDIREAFRLASLALTPAPLGRPSRRERAAEPDDDEQQTADLQGPTPLAPPTDGARPATAAAAPGEVAARRADSPDAPPSVPPSPTPVEAPRSLAPVDEPAPSPARAAAALTRGSAPGVGSGQAVPASTPAVLPAQDARRPIAPLPDADPGDPVPLPGNLGFSVDDFFGGLVRRIERRP